MEKTYDHLIGKTIVDNRNDEPRTLVVSHIDPDVGISLHREGDPNDTVGCLVHPDIYALKTKYARDSILGDDSWFRRMFRHWIEGIETGEFSAQWGVAYEKLSEFEGETGEHPIDVTLNEMCPFR